MHHVHHINTVDLSVQLRYYHRFIVLLSEALSWQLCRLGYVCDLGVTGCKMKLVGP